MPGKFNGGEEEGETYCTVQYKGEEGQVDLGVVITTTTERGSVASSRASESQHQFGGGRPPLWERDVRGRGGGRVFGGEGDGRRLLIGGGHELEVRGDSQKGPLSPFCVCWRRGDPDEGEGGCGEMTQQLPTPSCAIGLPIGRRRVWREVTAAHQPKNLLVSIPDGGLVYSYVCEHKHGFLILLFT